MPIRRINTQPTMNDIFQELGLKELKQLLGIQDDAALGDSLFFKRFKNEKGIDILNEPYKAGGYLSFFCIGGEFTVEINLTKVTVKKNSLLIVVPGNICRLSRTEHSDEEVEVLMMASSKEFLSSIRLDFMKLFNDSLNILDTPAITINDEQMEILRRYFILADSLIKTDIPNNWEAIRYVISSVFIYLGEVWTRNLKEAEQNSFLKQSIRSKIIFDNFIRLVTEYHNTYRNMAFYAERLCLTPKYLSKLVKNVSGRSAPDWIDSFVILEAKNLLKYSDKPIKEIVYYLHFPNQSVFYKFFKAHTGMTPSEYRYK